MNKTRVINVKSGEPFDVYIGRANNRNGFARSPLANPFRIGHDGTRDEVIDKYEAWLLSNPHLMAILPGLKGKTLGCWCKPDACHGDVLARLADMS